MLTAKVDVYVHHIAGPVEWTTPPGYVDLTLEEIDMYVEPDNMNWTSFSRNPQTGNIYARPPEGYIGTYTRDLCCDIQLLICHLEHTINIVSVADCNDQLYISF